MAAVQRTAEAPVSGLLYDVVDREDKEEVAFQIVSFGVGLFCPCGYFMGAWRPHKQQIGPVEAAFRRLNRIMMYLGTFVAVCALILIICLSVYTARGQPTVGFARKMSRAIENYYRIENYDYPDITG